MQVHQSALRELKTPSILIVNACNGHRHPRRQRLIHGIPQPPKLNPPTPPSVLRHRVELRLLYLPKIHPIPHNPIPRLCNARQEIPLPRHHLLHPPLLFHNPPLQPLDKPGALPQAVDGCSSLRLEPRLASTVLMEICFGLP